MLDAGESVQLQELHVGVNGIGERGAAGLAGWLKHNGTLVVLDLQLNVLGDAGVEALAEALAGSSGSALAALNLQGTGLGGKGLRALCDTLRQPDGPPVSELLLGHNPALAHHVRRPPPPALLPSCTR